MATIYTYRKDGVLLHDGVGRGKGKVAPVQATEALGRRGGKRPLSALEEVSGKRHAL